MAIRLIWNRGTFNRSHNEENKIAADHQKLQRSYAVCNAAVRGTKAPKRNYSFRTELLSDRRLRQRVKAGVDGSVSLV